MVMLSVGVLVSVGCVLLLMIWLQSNLIQAEWENSLQAQARLIAYNSQAANEFRDKREATELLKAVKDNPVILQVHFLVDSGEHVFASYNNPDLDTSFPHDHSYPEGGDGVLLEDDRLTVWAAIPGSGGTAAIEVVASLEYVRKEVRAMIHKTGLSLTVFVLVLLVVARKTATSIAAPLLRMTMLTDRMSVNPQIKDRLKVRGKDELARLATSINQMIDTLQLREAELEKYREGLEDEVEQRTKELVIAVEEAKAADRAKSDFLARMSHEIRTPMNAIVGLGNLLLKTQLNDSQRDYQEQVIAASDMLLGLINDILDYSKIEAGKLEIEQVDFSLEHVMRDVSAQVALRAQDRGLELLFYIDPQVPHQLNGDPLRLRQVLVNLANNAVKFTEQGEVVVQVGLSSDGTRLCCAVRDTGLGIAQDKLAELFSPFTQVDGSVTRKFGGTGLGLAICHQLVELMGGRIWVESEVGTGSTFSFELPLRVAQNSEQGRSIVGDVQYKILERIRVLVIDDNASAREVLQSMLEAFGMRTQTVASGEEGVQALRQASAAGDPFELVLLDWLMPGMDGIETARSINSSLADEIPAILMVTAGSYERLSGLIDSVGLKHILTKPVSFSALHDSVLEALLARGAISIDSSIQLERPAQKTQVEYDFSPISYARVLLVDDVALNRTVARAFLEETGVQVDVAVHGLDAINKIESNHYDLVLMDIQMPEMDGLTATREIRKKPQFADLPILAMTAHAMAGDRENSLAAGMNDHLTKPIDHHALYSAMLKWIKHRGDETADNAAAIKPKAEPQVPQLEGVDTLKGLAHCMNRPDLYLRLLGNFTEEFGSHDQAIAAALAAADWELARRLAHSLKSGAATLGAMDLSAQAKTLEDCFAAQQQAEPQVLEQLAQLLAQLCEQIAGMDSQQEQAQDTQEVDTAGLLEQLHEYLEKDDARALEVLAQLQQQFKQDATISTHLEQIQDLVEDVENEEALEVLATVRQLI